MHVRKMSGDKNIAKVAKDMQNAKIEKLDTNKKISNEFWGPKIEKKWLKWKTSILA